MAFAFGWNGNNAAGPAAAAGGAVLGGTAATGSGPSLFKATTGYCMSSGMAAPNMVPVVMRVEFPPHEKKSVVMDVLRWEQQRQAEDGVARVSVAVRAYYGSLEFCGYVGQPLVCLSLAFYAHNQPMMGLDRMEYPTSLFEGIPGQQIDWRGVVLESFSFSPKTQVLSQVTPTPMPFGGVGGSAGLNFAGSVPVMDLVFKYRHQVFHNAFSYRDVAFGAWNTSTHGVPIDPSDKYPTGPSLPIVSLFSSVGVASKPRVIHWDLFDSWTTWTPKTHDLFPYRVRSVIFQLWLIRRFRKDHPLSQLDSNVLGYICSLVITSGSNIARDGPGLVWQPIQDSAVSLYVDLQRQHKAQGVTFDEDPSVCTVPGHIFGQTNPWGGRGKWGPPAFTFGAAAPPGPFGAGRGAAAAHPFGAGRGFVPAPAPAAAPALGGAFGAGRGIFGAPAPAFGAAVAAPPPIFGAPAAVFGATVATQVQNQQQHVFGVLAQQEGERNGNGHVQQPFVQHLVPVCQLCGENHGGTPCAHGASAKATGTTTPGDDQRAKSPSHDVVAEDGGGFRVRERSYSPATPSYSPTTSPSTLRSGSDSASVKQNAEEANDNTVTSKEESDKKE